LHRLPRRPAALLLAIALITLAAFANANPLPQTLERVDPKAPCFRWPAVDYDEDGIYDRVDYCPNTPKGCAVDQWGCMLDADDDGVCDTFDRCPNTPKDERADKEGCSKSQTPSGAQSTPPPTKATQPRSQAGEALARGETVRLENVEFDPNSDRLTPESEKTLNGIGEALSDYPDLKFEIGGHSDTHGDAEANRVLSQKRAESVRTYLLAHSSLKPENLTAKGYGETQPLTKERDADELHQNRRVEIKLLNPEALPKNVKVEHH